MQTPNVSSDEISSICLLKESIVITLQNTGVFFIANLAPRKNVLTIIFTQEEIPPYVDILGPTNIATIDLGMFPDVDSVVFKFSDESLTLASKK